MNAILKVVGDYISNLNFVFDLLELVLYGWVRMALITISGLDHYF